MDTKQSCAFDIFGRNQPAREGDWIVMPIAGVRRIAIRIERPVASPLLFVYFLGLWGRIDPWRKTSTDLVHGPRLLGMSRPYTAPPPAALALLDLPNDE
jgi:hypothetical protein